MNNFRRSNLVASLRISAIAASSGALPIYHATYLDIKRPPLSLSIKALSVNEHFSEAGVEHLELNCYQENDENGKSGVFQYHVPGTCLGPSQAPLSLGGFDLRFDESVSSTAALDAVMDSMVDSLDDYTEVEADLGSNIGSGKESVSTAAAATASDSGSRSSIGALLGMLGLGGAQPSISTSSTFEDTIPITQPSTPIAVAVTVPVASPEPTPATVNPGRSILAMLGRDAPTTTTAETSTPAPPVSSPPVTAPEAKEPVVTSPLASPMAVPIPVAPTAGLSIMDRLRQPNGSNPTAAHIPPSPSTIPSAPEPTVGVSTLPTPVVGEATTPSPVAPSLSTPGKSILSVVQGTLNIGKTTATSTANTTDEGFVAGASATSGIHLNTLPASLTASVDSSVAIAPPVPVAKGATPTPAKQKKKQLPKEEDTETSAATAVVPSASSTASAAGGGGVSSAELQQALAALRKDIIAEIASSAGGASAKKGDASAADAAQLLAGVKRTVEVEAKKSVEAAFKSKQWKDEVGQRYLLLDVLCFGV
jgi:hypothetical protein